MGDDTIGGDPAGGGVSAFPSDASPAAMTTASWGEATTSGVPALPPLGSVDRDELVPSLGPTATTDARGEVFPMLPPAATVACREVFPALPPPASALGDDLATPVPCPVLTEGPQPRHSFEVSSHCKSEVQFPLCSRSNDSK
jgi:hypothetical protein